jgi:hypothetical protein
LGLVGPGQQRWVGACWFFMISLHYFEKRFSNIISLLTIIANIPLSFSLSFWQNVRVFLQKYEALQGSPSIFEIIA